MTAYPAKLIDLLNAAVLDCFSSNGIQVKATPAPAANGTTPAETFAASLGFSGALIQGALVVSADKAFLGGTHPQRDYGRPLTDDDLGDWIGEIANQVVGALKRSTTGYKVDFLLGTPTVMRGVELRVAASKDQKTEILTFDAEPHVVTMHFSATLAPDVSFEGEPSGEQAASGDTMLF